MSAAGKQVVEAVIGGSIASNCAQCLCKFSRGRRSCSAGVVATLSSLPIQGPASVQLRLLSNVTGTLRNLGAASSAGAWHTGSIRQQSAWHWGGLRLEGVCRSN